MFAIVQLAEECRGRQERKRVNSIKIYCTCDEDGIMKCTES
jgi:hypothetical protein